MSLINEHTTITPYYPHFIDKKLCLAIKGTNEQKISAINKMLKAISKIFQER